MENQKKPGNIRKKRKISEKTRKIGKKNRKNHFSYVFGSLPKQKSRKELTKEAKSKTTTTFFRHVLSAQKEEQKDVHPHCTGDFGL